MGCLDCVVLFAFMGSLLFCGAVLLLLFSFDLCVVVLSLCGVGVLGWVWLVSVPLGPPNAKKIEFLA